MKREARLRWSLAALRLSVFVVMAAWTVDKLVRPDHAAKVFAGPNLLFFAAWPMLAACLALFLLRDEDKLATVGSRRARR